MKSGPGRSLIALSEMIRAHPEFIAGAIVMLSLIVLLVLGWK